MNVQEFEAQLDLLIISVQSQLRAKHRYNPEKHKQYDTKGTTRGCGCSVCVARYEYAEAAKNLHRSKKHLELMYESMGNPSEIQQRIDAIQEKVSILKQRYHKLNEEIKKLQS